MLMLVKTPIDLECRVIFIAKLPLDTQDQSVYSTCVLDILKNTYWFWDTQDQNVLLRNKQARILLITHYSFIILATIFIHYRSILVDNGFFFLLFIVIIIVMRTKLQERWNPSRIFVLIQNRQPRVGYLIQQSIGVNTLGVSSLATPKRFVLEINSSIPSAACLDLFQTQNVLTIYVIYGLMHKAKYVTLTLQQNFSGQRTDRCSQHPVHQQRRLARPMMILF